MWKTRFCKKSRWDASRFLKINSNWGGSQLLHETSTSPYGNLYENFLSRQRKNYLFNRSYVFFFKSIALFCEKKRNWIQTQNQADNRIAFVHSFAKTKRSRLTSLTFPGARQPRFVFPIFKSSRYWIIFSSPQGYRVSRKISDGKHKCKLPYKGFHFIIN